VRIPTLRWRFYIGRLQRALDQDGFTAGESNHRSTFGSTTSLELSLLDVRKKFGTADTLAESTVCLAVRIHS